MKQIFSWLLVALGLVVIGIFGCSAYNQTAASKIYAYAEAARARGEASALVINAQAESRLHSAQAGAITQASNLATLVLGIASIFGVCTLALAGVLLHQNRQPIRTIERQTIFVLVPGQSRRHLWRLVSSEVENVKILPRNIGE